jgi:endoglucanase
VVPSVLRILERLARRPTAPLHEHEVLREATAIARSFGASTRSDPHGNLVVAPPGRRTGTPIWLVAHTDHPGFEVAGRREALFLGGVNPAYFRRGTRVRFFHEGEVIAAKLGRGRFSRRPFRLDLVGPEAGRLQRGDFGVWEVEDFRRSGDRLRARQFDDLAGSAVSLAVMERVCRRQALNVRTLLTRAEEIGFVGTLGAAVAGRIPRNAYIINNEASKAIPGVAIGGGPVIRVGDRTRTFDATAEDLLLAAKARLPPSTAVQRALMTGGTCEATAWSLFGYRATGVAIPLGNYHNQGPANRVRPEVVSAKDLAVAVDLIETAAKLAGGVPRGERLRSGVLRQLRRYGPRLRASRP